jgi:hypothetical protein
VNLAASLLLWPGLRETGVGGWVSLLQGNVVASAAVALAWLATRRRLYPGGIAEARQARLLGVQVALALAGNALLLAPPALWLVLEPASSGGELTLVGAVWGWMALLGTAAACVWHAGDIFRRGVLPVLCALGLGLGVLAACTVAGWWPGRAWLAYYTLTVGWALTGALALTAGLAEARRVRRLDMAPGVVAARLADLAASVCGCVAAVCALLVGLALRSSADDPAAPWWPAAVILVSSVLAAGVALWRRSEGWVLAAALGLNLSVSLVLASFHRDEALENWWVYFLQANASAAAVAALGWLAASPRLYGTPRPALTAAPLLTLHVVLAAVLVTVPLAAAAAALIAQPAALASSVLQAGHPAGGLALLLVGLAAGWRFGRRSGGRRVHALGCASLALAVQAAVSTAAWMHDGWLAYRVLTFGVVLAGLVEIAAGWLWARRQAAHTAEASSRPFPVEQARAWVAGLCLLALWLALRGFGADPGGAGWSAAAVVLVGLTAALTALWARSETWALAAVFSINLAVSLLLWDSQHGRPLADWWVPLVQANVLACAAAALLWLAAERLLGGREPGATGLLSVPVGLALLGNVALLLDPLTWLVLTPGDLPPSVAQAGELWGWLSLLAALAAASWHVGRRLGPVGTHVLCLLGLGAGVLAACTAARADAQDWLAYHTLMDAWAVAAAAVLTVGRWAETQANSDAVAALRGWATGIATLVVGLALRALGADPTGPYWPAASLAVTSLLAGAMALWSGRQIHVYASGLLFTLAGLVLRDGWHLPWELATTGALCLALASLLWSAVDAAFGASADSTTARAEDLPFRHVAAILAAALVATLAGGAIAAVFGDAAGYAVGPITWVALVASAFALAACLREPGLRFPLAGLYLLGLCALALALHALAPAPRWLAGPLLSAYVLLAAWLAHLGRRSRLAAALRRGGPWFAPPQLALAGTVVGLSVWTCLEFPIHFQRQMGTLSVALLLPAALLGARGAGRLRPALRHAALGLGALLAVEAGWAWLGDTPTPWLHRSGLALAVFAPLTVLYGLLLPRRLHEDAGWAAAARRAGVVVGALSIAVMGLVLAQELALYPPGLPAAQDRPGAVFVLAVAAALVVMLLTALSLAVGPDLDPLSLSERGRTAYVYAGEILLALTFAHLRLTAPELFGGRLARYWPFVVVAVAFLGAAAGELFRRLRLRVLAEPLQRTGVFLPVLPVVAFWLQPVGEYALLWFTVSFLYVFLSVTRRSLAFLLLATAAANVGLWLVLHQNQLAFVRHPQLWLIPFALSVLGAEHLNRDRLTRGQRNGVRYLALSAIYVSSTAELFLAGLGQDAVRPAALVGLSVLGVFLGMLLRVRAFLFLGSGFLLLGLFAVIRHAAHAAADRGRIVWLVAGIITGAAIFVLFAVFEKRRNDVLRLLQRLRDWE